MTAVAIPIENEPTPRAMDHHPLGVSTGIFTHDRGAWPALVADACGVSSHAVELSALSGSELSGLAAYLQDAPAMPFRYISVHAPAKRFVEADATVILRTFPSPVRAVIVHPDMVDEPNRYRALGSRLVFENMDARKSDGRTVQELERYFELLPEAGFCLDVAHAWSLDPTMGLAYDLLDHFRSRLRQLHISSLDSGSHHVSLRSRDERLFMPVLERCRDLPWIFEAPLPRLPGAANDGVGEQEPALLRSLD